MTKTALHQLQNGLLNQMPLSGRIPNRIFGELVTSMLRTGMIFSILEIFKECWRYLSYTYDRLGL